MGMCRVDTMGRDRETVSDSEKRLSPTVSVGDLCVNRQDGDKNTRKHVQQSLRDFNGKGVNSELTANMKPEELFHYECCSCWRVPESKKLMSGFVKIFVLSSKAVIPHNPFSLLLFLFLLLFSVLFCVSNGLQIQ